MPYTVPNMYMRTVNSTYRSWPSSPSNLLAGAGDFSVNGQDNIVSVQRRLISGAGNLVQNGQSVNLLRASLLVIITVSITSLTNIRFNFSGGLAATSWQGYYRTPSGSGTYTPVSLTVGQTSHDITVASGGSADFYVTATNAGGTLNSSVASGSAAGGVTSTPNLFYDSFESANMSSPNGPSPALDAIGFAWSVNQLTSIVTMEAGVPYAVYNNGVIHNQGPVGSEWTAKDGNYSLRFRYPAGAAGNTENRFAFTQGLPEFWLRYWLYIPSNFYYPNAGTNQKFLSTWTLGGVHDEYPGEMTLQLRPNGSGAANLMLQDGGVTVGEVEIATGFIQPARDGGKWMRLCIHGVAPTTTTSNDGLIEIYQMLDGVTSFTMLYQKTDLAHSWIRTDRRGLGGGFFMGYNNTAYAATTEFLIDTVEISTNSLVT